MKILVDRNDLTTIKVVGDDDKVWVNIFIAQDSFVNKEGLKEKDATVLIRTEIGEIKGKFLEEFPYQKEVLFWEYQEAK